jgi:hypothetical protein
MAHVSPTFAVLSSESAYATGKAVGTFMGTALVALVALGIPVLAVVSLIRYSKTKDSSWRVALILSGGLTLLMMVLVTTAFLIGVYRGYREKEQGRASAAVDRTVESADGVVRLTRAESWHAMPELNSQAVIQVGNPAREEYLIAFSGAKTDYEGSLRDYAELNVDAILDSLSGGNSTDLREIRLNQRTAYECEVSGSVGGIKIEYCFTAVEGTDHYVHLLAWTLPSKKARAFPVLREVIQTCEVK